MKFKPYQHDAKYYETDQMAVVHHSNYIRWFEEARIDWMEQAGIHYDEMEARGIIIPVVGVSAEYKTMTHFRDTVEVFFHLDRYNGVRFSMRYQVRDARTGELRCTGTSEHCFLARESYRPINLKRHAPDYHAIFSDMLAGQDELPPER